jgi:hypothetical protein
MLKNEVPDADLIQERANLKYIIPKEVQEYFHPEKEDLYDLHFPVLEFPKKITSLNLDKTPNFSGKLMGIKGQYLIFQDGTVFNVRTFEGYVVKISL